MSDRIVPRSNAPPDRFLLTVKTPTIDKIPRLDSVIRRFVKQHLLHLINEIGIMVNHVEDNENTITIDVQATHAQIRELDDQRSNSILLGYENPNEEEAHGCAGCNSSA